MNYFMREQLLSEGYKHDQIDNILNEAEEWEVELSKKFNNGEISEMALRKEIYKHRPSLKGTNFIYREVERIKGIRSDIKDKKLYVVSKKKSEEKLQQTRAAYRGVNGKKVQWDYQKQKLGLGKSELALPGGRRVTLECARQMMEDGLITEELFTEGVKDVIVKKILPGLMMAGMIAGAGKGIADTANKCYAMQSQVTDAEFNSGVYGFSFKNKYYTYDEKKNTVTIDDGKTRKTRKINRLDRVVPDQGHYSQERYGYMHEEVLDEEISKKVTKKIKNTEKLANKFLTQSEKAVEKIKNVCEYKKYKGEELSDAQVRKLLKVTLQLNKAKQEIKNLKNLSKVNDKYGPEDVEDLKVAEKQMLRMVKNCKKEIKNSMDDPIIKTILRDLGVVALFSGTSIASGSPEGIAIGSAVGAYNVYAIHHNRNVRRNKSLLNGHEINTWEEKENIKENYFNY